MLFSNQIAFIQQQFTSDLAHFRPTDPRHQKLGAPDTDSNNLDSHLPNSFRRLVGIVSYFDLSRHYCTREK